MKDLLIEKLQELCVRRGEFTLASGKKSDFYIDVRNASLDAMTLGIITTMIVEELKGGIVAVGGPVSGAIPLVGGVLEHLCDERYSMKGFMVRKSAKGLGHWIEGGDHIPKSAEVAILEDVVTSGGSVLRAIEKTEFYGGMHVVQVVAVVDRQEGGREAIEAAGYEFTSLVTKEDLL